MNNYIVRSYRDVIVVTNTATRRTNNYIVRSYRDVIVVTNTAARRTNKA